MSNVIDPVSLMFFGGMIMAFVLGAIVIPMINHYKSVRKGVGLGVGAGVLAWSVLYGIIQLVRYFSR